MSSNRPSDKSNSDLLQLGVDALMQHEKQMDIIIKKLIAKKVELLSDTEKLNANLDEMDKKLRAIENELSKIKSSLQT